MTTCDPAYETCPADNSTMTEEGTVAVMSPLVYAWGLVPVLQLASAFLITGAWSDAYKLHNALTTTTVANGATVG